MTVVSFKVFHFFVVHNFQTFVLEIPCSKKWCFNVFSCPHVSSGSLAPPSSSVFPRKALGLINEPQIQPGHKRGTGLYFGEITQVEKVEAALWLGFPKMVGLKTPKFLNHPWINRGNTILNHPFWGTPYFLETPICTDICPRVRTHSPSNLFLLRMVSHSSLWLQHE